MNGSRYTSVRGEREDRGRQEETGSSVEFAALFPSLYLHAVAEGLRNLSDHGNTRWAFTMRNALDRSGHGGDTELLRNDALKYAQELMEQPVGVFLTAAMSSEEGD